MRVARGQVRTHRRDGAKMFGKGRQILLDRHVGKAEACHRQTAKYWVVGRLTPIDRGGVAVVPAGDPWSQA